MDTLIAVVANRRIYFEYFIREVSREHRRKFRFVNRPQDLMGIRYSDSIIVGPPLERYVYQVYDELNYKIAIYKKETPH